MSANIGNNICITSVFKTLLSCLKIKTSFYRTILACKYRSNLSCLNVFGKRKGYS